MELKKRLEELLGQSINFGVDIGTSTSCVAYKERDAAPKTASYRGECRGGIPSLAWRDKNGNEWYCDQVMQKNGLLEDPAGVWASGKMKLGSKTVELNGHTYKPRYLMVREVQRVLKVSQEALEEEMVEMDTQTWVVGVPAWFTAAEKGELLCILEEATKGKNIRLVLEPILAALANYYFSKKNGRKPRRVLVFDMGGGTLDVVLLEPNEHPTAENPEPYIARNPDGLRIAGDVLDEKMEELILEELEKNPGEVKLDILRNKDHHDRRLLRQKAKEAKEKLSDERSCTVTIAGVECGITKINVTRDQYEAKIMPLIKETVALAADVLKRCNLGPNPDIDILMVGGSTYTPLIRTLLEQEFPWIPSENIMRRFPERAVALGAAIYAETPQIVRPKVAYGYAVNTHINNGREEVLRVIIPSAAELPMTVTADFLTMDENQASVGFSVYEVPNTEGKTHMKMDSGRITTYRISHRFAQRVPRETPVRLSTTLTEDGVLNMTVEDFQPDKRTTEKTFTMNNTISG